VSPLIETLEHIAIALINGISIVLAARWGARRERQKAGGGSDG
jgi:hypothetical protein